MDSMLRSGNPKKENGKSGFWKLFSIKMLAYSARLVHYVL